MKQPICICEFVFNSYFKINSYLEIKIYNCHWFNFFFRLFKIVLIRDTGSLDRNSLDRNCHFSVDRKFHNQLIKFF